MQNLRGILLMIAAMAGFALADMFIKLATATLPTGQILMVMGAGGGALFALLCLYRRIPLISKVFFHPMILTRNISEAIGGASFVTAFALTDLSTTSAIMQASPLIITMGAALFLHEPVGPRRWFAIGLGFLGMLIVIRPGLSGFEAASLFAVVGVIALSVRDLATRATPAQIPTPLMALYAFLLLVPTGALILLFDGTPALPDMTTSAQLAAMVLFGFLGYFAVTASIRSGELGVIAPFRYSRILFAMILGILVFGERPDAATWAGTALIVGSGLYAFLREARLARKQAMR
ncbi:DMT family transporter [Pseudoruegeria sp. SHC-113]|uniref:DMT family transporter n=1 Tax=Pseudoruegeria sp. SHC-113 TaxID=2855439 RepID=UPI0021BA9EF8|nr:DMT family transporter [Pseudoruegeria sp. SHC-113]MCT8159983.1 DMT family transporter [Pseudoruegeria sp. SHC-113]